MEINGTVTLALRDYSALHRLAKKGKKQLALHDELLDKLSKCISDIVYEPSMEGKQAQLVVAKISALSRSLPELRFYHDSDNQRIIVRLRDDSDTQ